MPYPRLTRLVNAAADEIQPLFWGITYFFSLLCSYYIIRPIRDAMGIAGGVENLHWLFTGTFLAMLALVPLFGWITSRYARKDFLPYVYYFFITNLLLFFLLFKSDLTHTYIARTFYIWASVFNLFIVSVFWSFMADVFTNEQAKRLFGVIAAGGSLGALAGPLLTTSLAESISPANLLPCSALLLGWSILCINRLAAWENRRAEKSGHAPAVDKSRPLAGGILSGVRLVMSSAYLLGICVFMLLFTTLSTFLYFQQAQIIQDNITDTGARTALFARIDLAVNALTILFQVFLTGRIVKTAGIAWTLALIPLLLTAGFIALGTAPILSVIVAIQIIRRAGDYAITRPAREMLYVVLSREEKYKAKNFIDTAIYRGGDAVSAWIYAGLAGLGLGLPAIALLAVPVTGIWAWLSYRLGKQQEQLAARQ